MQEEYHEQRQRQGKGQGTSRASGTSAETGSSGSSKRTSAGKGSKGGVVPWWERFPAIYENELHELKQHAIAFKRDEEAFSQGKLVLKVKLKIDGEMVDGEILYPDTFPYFRARVNVPNLQKGRHYNPLNGNLCLIERGSRQWNPSWTAAFHIVDSMPKWETSSSADSRDGVSLIEDHQAEPEAAYFPVQQGAIVVVDVGYEIPDEHSTGLLELGFLPNKPPSDMIRSGQLRAVLLRVLDSKKEELARMSEPMFSYYSSFFGTTYHARWIRLDKPPYGMETEGISFLEPDFPKTLEKIERWIQSGKECLIGFTFTQESDYSGTKRMGWLFYATFNMVVTS